MAVRKPATLEPEDGAHERLLVEAAQKDPARFADIYEANFEVVYTYVARRVADRGPKSCEGWRGAP